MCEGCHFGKKDDKMSYRPNEIWFDPSIPQTTNIPLVGQGKPLSYTHLISMGTPFMYLATHPSEVDVIDFRTLRALVIRTLADLEEGMNADDSLTDI